MAPASSEAVYIRGPMEEAAPAGFPCSSLCVGGGGVFYLLLTVVHMCRGQRTTYREFLPLDGGWSSAWAWQQAPLLTTPSHQPQLVVLERHLVGVRPSRPQLPVDLSFFLCRTPSAQVKSASWASLAHLRWCWRCHFTISYTVLIILFAIPTVTEGRPLAISPPRDPSSSSGAEELVLCKNIYSLSHS